MSPSGVRKIFIFFIIFLPVQYGLVGIMGYYHMDEHWPAFVFPGFKNVYDGEEGISLAAPRLSVLFADSPPQEISVSELLLDVPFSHHRAVMTRRFSTESIKNMDVDTINWLSGQLSSIYEDSEITGLEVIWTNDLYKRSQGEVVTETMIKSGDIIYLNE